jgi:ribonuclease D
VAVDTEFMRERTYYARLCLVQVGIDGRVGLVDPFEVDDLGPLFGLLTDGSVTKVLHAGEQDLEIFFRLMGRPVRPVFDTQVAAALASFPLQVGYGTLVRDLVGIELDKMDSYTDWTARPLSHSQVEYAAADVLHLLEVDRTLRERLARDGRLEWLEEDFAVMADAATYEVVPEEMYRRVKRRSRLKPREMGVLLHVAAWREWEAMRRDVPRGRVANDEALVQIASRKPQAVAKLRQIRGLHDRIVRESGESVLAAVRSGLEMPDDELPRMPRRPRSRVDVDALVDLMSAVVRARSREYGIAMPVLASRKEMEELARGEREDSSLLAGWKRSHVGEDLIALLEGRTTLSVDGERVRIDRREWRAG